MILTEKYEEAIKLMDRYDYIQNKKIIGDYESGFVDNYLIQKINDKIAVYDLSCFRSIVKSKLQQEIELSSANPHLSRCQFNFHGFQYSCEFLTFDDLDLFPILDKWSFLRFEERTPTPKDIILEGYISMMIKNNADPILSIEKIEYSGIGYCVIARKNKNSCYNFEILNMEGEFAPLINDLLDQEIQEFQKSTESKVPALYERQITFFDATFMAQYTYKNGKPFIHEIIPIIQPVKW